MKFWKVGLLMGMAAGLALLGQAAAQPLSREYVYLGDRVLAVENRSSGFPSGTLNPVSVTPASGDAASQTFTFDFSKATGGADLGVVNVLINRFLDGANACYLAYDSQGDVLYLVNDAGNGLLTVAVGKTTSGSNTNSQCTVSVSGSSSNPWATTSGTNLTVTASLTFATSPWASSSNNPDKVIWMAARTVGDTASSGWVPMGVRRVPPASSFLPRIESLTPSSGSGQRQVFTVTYRKRPGKTLDGAQLLMNGAIDGGYACYLGYWAAGGSLLLQNDANSGSVGYFTFDASGNGISSTGAPLQNSQCTIYGASRSQSGDLLTFTVDVGFTSGFQARLPQGRLTLYGGVQDSTPYQNSDWSPVSAWWLDF